MLWTVKIRLLGYAILYSAAEGPAKVIFNLYIPIELPEIAVKYCAPVAVLLVTSSELG